MTEIIPEKLKCEKCRSMEGIADFRDGGFISVLCEKHNQDNKKK